MALDPVNPKALKGKFKDSEDKDIDNDGDTDSSDEYLHKRRQAVSKAINKKVEEAKMTPDEIKKALASDKAKAQSKDKVSLKKPPFKMDEEAKQIDELSKDTLKSYRDKSKESSKELGAKLDSAPKDVMGGIKSKDHPTLDKLQNRVRGQRVSYKKLNAEEAKMTPDEIKKALASDKAKAQSKDKVSLKKPPFKMDEAVNEKQIRKDLDSGMSYDAVIGKHANKKTTNTDEIRKVIKQHAFDKRMKKESVVLKALRRISEAKDAYTVAHKTFSSAVQHAEEVAKKRGFEIDPEEWDRKVSMGPRKPGAGKTNSYKIDLMKDGKEVKQKLNMQVYYDEGRYELNMYIS